MSVERRGEGEESTIKRRGEYSFFTRQSRKLIPDKVALDEIERFCDLKADVSDFSELNQIALDVINDPERLRAFEYIYGKRLDTVVVFLVLFVFSCILLMQFGMMYALSAVVILAVIPSLRRELSAILKGFSLRRFIFQTYLSKRIRILRP